MEKQLIVGSVAFENKLVRDFFDPELPDKKIIGLIGEKLKLQDAVCKAAQAWDESETREAQDKALSVLLDHTVKLSDFERKHGIKT